MSSSLVCEKIKIPSSQSGPHDQTQAQEGQSEPPKQVQWKDHFHEEFKFEVKNLGEKIKNDRPVLVFDLNRVILTYDHSGDYPKQNL